MLRLQSHRSKPPTRLVFLHHFHYNQVMTNINQSTWCVTIIEKFIVPLLWHLTLQQCGNWFATLAQNDASRMKERLLTFIHGYVRIIGLSCSKEPPADLSWTPEVTSAGVTLFYWLRIQTPAASAGGVPGISLNHNTVLVIKSLSGRNSYFFITGILQWQSIGML